MKCHFLAEDGKREILQMGSYGLGLNRILAGSLELFSTDTELIWPDVLAPFNVIILPPKVRDSISVIAFIVPHLNGLS